VVAAFSNRFFLAVSGAMSVQKMRSRFVFLLLVLSSQAIAVFAQPVFPSEEQLSQWDARFLPGRYRIERYDVNVVGEPIAGDVRTEERCLSRADMENVSRSPFVVAAAWQCHTKIAEVKLTDSSLRLVSSCSKNQVNPALGLFAIEISQDQQRIAAAYWKMSPKGKAPSAKQLKQAAGDGSQLTWLGECAAEAAQKR
jgi:hypothetical protein